MLAYRDSGFGETPVHFSGLGDGKSTVCLQPFVTYSTPHVHSNKEVAWLTLRVSLRDVFSESLITDIIRWLKARPARKVSSLTIENVVQSASQISHFIRDEDRGGTSGPKFDHLSTSAKRDILAAWSDFRSLLAALATQLNSQYTVEGRDIQDQDVESYHADAVTRGPLATLVRLENGLLSLQGIVQRSVMALPDLYQNQESLLEAIEDTAMQRLGFVPLLKWRLNAQFPSASDNLMKIDHTVEEGSVQSTAFRSLVKEDLPNLGAVIIEYKSYDKATIPAGSIQRMEQNTQILVDILKLRGPPDFHSLQCIRWFHQEKETRLGLVFEWPVGCNTFKSLRNLIQADASSQRPTLAQRFLMVKSIGQALLKWHISANWVHQGIASHNIYFFKPRNSASYDYTRPYLCGFEFSRPSDGISLSTSVENFEENVYRHPSRQGAPSKYHTKQHDLYSYGILLFEVGVWNLISNCFDANMKKDLAPSEMQNRIKLNARKRLGHYMGAAYERAASRCLDMDFGVEFDDPVGTNLAKAFQELILQEIEPGTRLD